MNQIIRFPHCQFQVIQFRPCKQIHLRQRKQIHLHPRKVYLAMLQLRPRKEYFVIQFRPRKQLQFQLHLRPTEDRSQMNCASISDTAETPDSSSVRVVGSNNHSLSITDLPLTQEKVETTYADVFQGLGKFPGEPYKLRLKPDAVPAKHRPRRVPVHLQDAFHEEVERLVKIDVLEKVTEPTEWVNSFVIVEKVIDSSNAHSPNHSIKKSIRLCIDPKDLNESIRKRTLLQQIH